MWTALQPNHTPIVIDIQDDHVIAVQLVRRKGKWRPAASVSVRRQQAVQTDPAVGTALALTDEEFAAIDRGLTRQGVIGRDVVLMSPPGATCVELLELPPRGPDTPIEELARAEMARLARWDDSTAFQLCTWDVPPPLRRAGSESTAATSLYAAALPEAAVAGVVQQFWSHGWSVQRIVAAPLAAAAVASTIHSDQATAADAASVVIDLRWSRAAVTLVRGDIAIYHRDLPDNGLALLARAIVADLHLSAEDVAAALELGSFELRDRNSRAHGLCEGFADALATELEASLAFASRRYGEVRITQLLVVGPGARIGGLDAWLSGRLEIEPRAADQVHPLCSDLAIAPCVALAQISARPTTDVGLLPAAQKDLVRREHTAKRWVAVTATLVAFAIAGVGALYASAFVPTQVDAARMAGFQQEQTRADADAVESKRQLADVRTVVNFEDRLAHQPDYSELLRIIGGVLEQDTCLRDISMTEALAKAAAVASPAAVTPLRRVKLLGTAPSAAALNNQVTALRGLDIFDHVELARTSRSADGEGVSFELSMDVVARPAARGTK